VLRSMSQNLRVTTIGISVLLLRSCLVTQINTPNMRVLFMWLVHQSEKRY
jgi:hypothetical protein